MTGQARLTLEQFAALAAQMDVGIPKDEVLHAARMSPEDWDATQALWLQRMADQADHGRYSLSQRYAALFAEHRKVAALRKSKERKPLTGPLPSAPQLVRSPLIVMDQLVRAAPRPIAAQPGMGGPAPRAAPPMSPHGPAQGAPIPPPQPSSRAPAPKSTPAPMPMAVGEPLLTVEQFASLRAELVVSPEAQHAEIRTRYKLDEASWPHEEAAWQKRFAADKPMFQRYLKQFQYMRGLLAPR